MKRVFVAAASLSLLLLLAGLAQAAPMTVNLIGKFEGTAKVVQNAGPPISTSMTLRITSQYGELFQCNVTFPAPYGDGTPSNLTGALYDGALQLTDNTVVVTGNFVPTTPPQISGCFHSLKISQDQTSPETGVFLLKRTSTNPNQ